MAALSVAPRPRTTDYAARALGLWPGLDRVKLRRTHGDPTRIARLVGQRTALPPEAIVGLLTRDTPSDDEGDAPDAARISALITGARARG